MNTVVIVQSFGYNCHVSVNKVVYDSLVFALRDVYCISHSLCYLNVLFR